MTSTRMFDSLRSVEYLVDDGDPMAESDEFKLVTRKLATFRPSRHVKMVGVSLTSS